MFPRRFLSIVFLLVCLSGCISNVSKDHHLEWMEYEEGMERAEEEGMPILIYFCSPDIDFCRTVEKKIFENKTVLEMLEDFVKIKVNVNDPDQSEILYKHRFYNTPYPVVIFMDEKGKEVNRLVAYRIYDPYDERSIERFIEVVNASLHNKTVGEDIRFTTLSGDERRLSDYRGKVIVLDLFTTHCPACKTQMIYLHQLMEMHEKDVQVISLDVAGDSEESIRSTYGEYIDEWTFGIDRYGEATKFYVLEGAVPTIVLLDEDGKIFYLRPGVVSTQYLTSLIDSLLREDG